ncbi:MAG TPA: hypothetical protein VLA91_05635 [Acidimicrobiia bacterium]|nr:hypothetical protein [Acidimicrobiia bacterium]
MIRTTLLLVVFAVAAAACGADAETTATAANVSSTTDTEVTTMPTTEPGQLPIVAPARADLAERLRVPPEEIEVVTAEQVTWPDGSLGCPEPGMSYTQALVEGSKVILGHDDRVYVYHAGADDQPFLCPSEDKDGGHDFVPPPGFNE